MTMTPAYAMNPHNAGTEIRACRCGAKFQTGKISLRAKCNRCYKKSDDERCRRCAETGMFITGTTNGIPTGPGGKCFRCGGKGFQTKDDRKRNWGYDVNSVTRGV